MPNGLNTVESTVQKGKSKTEICNYRKTEDGEKLDSEKTKNTTTTNKKKFSRKTDNNKNDDPKSLTDKQYKCEIQHHAKIISMYCLNHIRRTHPSTSL